MNMFMKHIYNKKRFNFKAKIKYKKFIKSLQKTMPNFGTLWEVSQFIRILEITCFYNNNSTTNKDSSFLFSSTKYPQGTDGFCVKTPELFIKYKLFEKDHRICIEIDRLLGNNIKTNMEFSDIDNVELNISDSLILENIINITMDLVIELLKKYYKARKI